MIRYFLSLVAFCILLAAPYVFFQVRINEAFLGASDAGAWNLLRFVKFGAYSLAAPAVVLAIWMWGRRKGKSGRFFTGVAVGVYLLVLLVVTNFYDYFGIVPHWKQLGNVDEAGSVGSHIFRQLVGIEDWWSALAVIGASVVLFSMKTPLFKGARWIPALLALPAMGLLAIQNVRHPMLESINARGYTMACSHYGILPTYGVMLKDFIPRDRRVVDFPMQEPRIAQSDRFGQLKGANVLMIQVESLDSGLVGRKVGDELVMPFLTKLARESVYFPDCVAMHAGGGSSDAELASLLSLVPLTSGSGFNNADWSQVMPLSKVVNQAGYQSTAMHANRGSFYDRARRYADMEFSAFYDQKAFSDSAAGWYSRDLAFFSQSLEKLKNKKQPFLSYWITMQSHGPFQNYDDQTRKDFDQAELESYSEMESDYFCTFRDVDAALSDLFRDLKSSGLLESTLVVLFGDHESAVVENGSLAGERVPLILSHPKLNAALGERLVSHIDVAPTVTDLLGLMADKSWLGRSVFAGDDLELVALPNGKAIVSADSLEENFNETSLRVVDYSRAILGQ